MMPLKRVDRLPLTPECHHYTRLSQVPWDIQKYWQQRYSIFSYYDSDIRMTDDAWFGVTPEPVAWKIAEDLATAFSPIPDPLSQPESAKALPIAVDLFAGAGGNTIPLGLSASFSHVIAIEKDTATLACAQHNAYVNEVPDKKVTWILGDSFDFLARLKSNPEQLATDLNLSASLPKGLKLATSNVILFASPPWGGVSYVDQKIFNLATMEPYNLATLHETCSPMPHALYLPRTSDVRQLAKLVPKDRKKKMDVVQYCMFGASKAMVAYFPAAAEQTTVATTSVNGVNGMHGSNETQGTNGTNEVNGRHETAGIS